MAQVEKVTVTDDNAVAGEPKLSGQRLAARIIWFVAGILLWLLAIRFVLALLGANLTNPFAEFIYNVTNPFVSPFFSLFSYEVDLNNPASRLEGYTLVAMLVYAMIAAGLAKLVTINKPNPS